MRIEQGARDSFLVFHMDAQGVESSSSAFPGIKQRAGSKAHHSGHKQASQQTNKQKTVPMVLADGRLAYYATLPVFLHPTTNTVFLHYGSLYEIISCVLFCFILYFSSVLHQSYPIVLRNSDPFSPNCCVLFGGYSTICINIQSRTCVFIFLEMAVLDKRIDHN